MIRPFQEQDTGTAVAIWLAASIQAHHFVPRAYWENRTEDMRTLYLPLSETVVYEDDDTGLITGFMSFVDSWLSGLFVDPSHQGQGIGSRLLRLGLKMHPSISLSVYAANEKAVHFYMQRGFRFIGERLEKATGQKELLLETGK